MSHTFYVQAGAPLAEPNRAVCAYYTDYACTQRVESPLKIPQDAGMVTFVLVPFIASANPSPTPNNWLLVGAVDDRVDTPAIDPSMTLAAANAVSITMPTTQQVQQGVILLFSSQGATTQLFASKDPIIENNDA